MRKWLVPSILVALLAAITGSILVSRHTPPAFESLSVPEQNLAMYDAFWSAIDANYFDPRRLATPAMRDLRASWRAKAEAANALTIYSEVLQPLAAQFPHSHLEVSPNFTPAGFMATLARSNPSERARRAQQAVLSGQGFEAATIRRAGGLQKVVGDVLPGSAAARAGITPGWKVVSAVRVYLPTEERAVFKGEFQATQLGASPRRIEFDLEPVPERRHFEVAQLAGGVKYVRFDLFGGVGEPDAVIAAVDAAGPRGLVLDLRGNAGGINDDMLRIAGRVLGDGVPVGTARGRASSQEERTTVQRHYTGPLVVLIGPATSSAAEILAAAVQDHARGKIIGRASNGSALSARNFPLPGGGMVMVPTQDFVRVTGRHIESTGVSPDIEIMPTLDDVRAGRDSALDRALAEIAAAR